MTDFTKANDAERARNNGASKQRAAVTDGVNPDAATPGYDDDSGASSTDDAADSDARWTDRFKPENLPGN
jgi:hypothetical protein